MQNNPTYNSLSELIATMKEVVHREYFSGIKETVLIDSIEKWIEEGYRAGLKKALEVLPVEVNVKGEPTGLWTEGDISHNKYRQQAIENITKELNNSGMKQSDPKNKITNLRYDLYSNPLKEYDGVLEALASKLSEVVDRVNEHEKKLEEK